MVSNVFIFFTFIQMKFLARYVTVPLHKKSGFLFLFFVLFFYFFFFFFLNEKKQSCSLKKPCQKKTNNDKTLMLIMPNCLTYEPFNTTKHLKFAHFWRIPFPRSFLFLSGKSLHPDLYAHTKRLYFVVYKQ